MSRFAASCASAHVVWSCGGTARWAWATAAGMVLRAKTVANCTPLLSGPSSSRPGAWPGPGLQERQGDFE
eukprot:4138553-Amphidinium_carterae.1